MLRWTPLLALVATGCGDDGTPAYALDPIWLEPAADGGVYGFQTWEIFSARWESSLDEKHYLCGIVVELQGTPSDEICDGCELAWDVQTSVLETDCGAGIASDPGFLALTRLGLGPVAPDLTSDDPYPARSQGGYADYGTGDWVAHGWAYPESLDSRGQAADTDWNAEQPFTFWPAWFWEL